MGNAANEPFSMRDILQISALLSKHVRSDLVADRTMFAPFSKNAQRVYRRKEAGSAPASCSRFLQSLLPLNVSAE